MRGRVLLIVDDEQDLRDILCDLMTEEGYQCLAASTAAEALGIISGRTQEHKNIDLIISDMNMPGGNGMELLTEVRKKGVMTPFFFLSGENIDEAVSAHQKIGVLGYHLKPISADEFVNRVQLIFSSLAVEKTGASRTHV